MLKILFRSTAALVIVFAVCNSNVFAQQTGGTTAGDVGGATGADATGGSATGSAAGVTNDFQQQSQTGLRDNLSAAEQVFDPNARQGDGFVGGPSENFADTFGQVQGQGGGGFGGLGNFIQALGNINQGAGQVTRGRRIIRAPLRLGFTVSKPAESTVAARFEDRLTRLPAFKGFDGVQASLENGTLTLIGAVPNAEKRDLIGRVALLEPGVYRVNNQLEFTEAIGQ